MPASRAPAPCSFEFQRVYIRVEASTRSIGVYSPYTVDNEPSARPVESESLDWNWIRINTFGRLLLPLPPLPNQPLHHPSHLEIFPYLIQNPIPNLHRSSPSSIPAIVEILQVSKQFDFDDIVLCVLRAIHPLLHRLGSLGQFSITPSGIFNTTTISIASPISSCPVIHHQSPLPISSSESSHSVSSSSSASCRTLPSPTEV